MDLSKIVLPKIGAIVGKNKNGTFKQGPIPGIGGPFKTAPEFFRAWAAKTKFGLTDEGLRAQSGQYYDEVVGQVASFPHFVSGLAEKLATTRPKGPFPLFHGSFGHNHIIVDDQYQILGIVNWTAAFAAPWDIFGQFPLGLSIMPIEMILPTQHEKGVWPKDVELDHRLECRKIYVDAVRKVEREMEDSTCLLSTILTDKTRQPLIKAMSLFESGKAGYYANVVNKSMHPIWHSLSHSFTTNPEPKPKKRKTSHQKPQVIKEQGWTAVCRIDIKEATGNDRPKL